MIFMRKFFFRYFYRLWRHSLAILAVLLRTVYYVNLFKKSFIFNWSWCVCLLSSLSLSLGFRQAFTSLRCALYFPIAHFFQWRSSFFLSFNCLFIFSDGATCVTHMNSQRTQKNNLLSTCTVFVSVSLCNSIL